MQNLQRMPNLLAAVPLATSHSGPLVVISLHEGIQKLLDLILPRPDVLVLALATRMVVAVPRIFAPASNPAVARGKDGGGDDDRKKKGS